MPDKTTVESIDGAATAGDRIRLVLPADSDYGRIARIAASNLALRLGFAFGEIEDLRIAIDEAIILLLRADGGGSIAIEFTIEPDAIVVDAFAEHGSGRVSRLEDAARNRFDEIVADTVEVAEVDQTNAHIHLVKHRQR